MVDIGNRHFEVLHLPGHSPGSIGLWEEASGTLFSGDAVYDGPLLDELGRREGAKPLHNGGIELEANLLEGQKTGSFLDQRENYAAAARYAHGEALDVFCYQGGFALHIAQACARVTGVDSSRIAACCPSMVRSRDSI